jgi:hypothetical protein
MIQSKKKHCDGCSQPKYIWKNRGGKKYCKTCWSCHEGNVKLKPTAKQKRISPRSEKRIIADKKYSKLRKAFLEEKPICEAQLIGCAGTSCQVHHKAGRTGDLYLDVSKWLAVCHQCHVWIENNVTEAKKLGFSLNRL